jgi:hypothetical protein
MHYHLTNQAGEAVTWPVFKTAQQAARNLRTAYGRRIAASGYVKSDQLRAACPMCH